jgi:hypothetical protein
MICDIMRKSVFILLLCAGLAACQSTGQQSFDINRDCAVRKVGSKALAKATGIGLGLLGVPGGGLVGRGVSAVTDPRCQALTQRPENPPKVEHR